MLTKLIALSILVGLSTANAADPSFFIVKGDKLEPVKKVDAMRALITSDNKTEVVKCTPVKVDEDKGTLRNR